MTIYRGPGGTGTATSDSDTTEFQEFVVDAQAARDAALAAQTAAELAETNAETAETNAETAETNAETAATNAASSASSAASSASSASSSASAASTSASNASSSASSASTSASAASSSASAASTSASNAATSATNAASSATAAASSATSASSSASTATTQATTAAASASAASTSASSASAAQTAAEAARDAALSAYDNFDDRYLGPKSSDPTLDNDGNALLTGALYFNTSSNVMKVYTGSSWVAAYVSAAGVLLTANNLSDVASTATSRTNLNVPTRTGGDASGTWGIDITGNAATATTATSATSATSATTATNVSGGTASVTSITDSGNLTFTGTGNRITGDFSNATIANRVMFQTSTANGNTQVGIIPSGTARGGFLQLFDGSDPANATYLQLASNTGTTAINSTKSGTGPYADLAILTGGSERMRVDTSGNVGVGTSSPQGKLDVTGTGDTLALVTTNTSGNPRLGLLANGVVYNWIQTNRSDSSMQFAVGNTERARIDSSGNVGIGTSSPSARLHATKNNADVARFTNSLSNGGDWEFKIGGGGFEDRKFMLTDKYGGADNVRLAVDSSGNLLVGTTTQRDGAKITNEFTTGNNGISLYCVANTNAVDFAVFRANAGALCGNISRVGTTNAVTYASASDYRLKENIAPMIGALEKVAKLKPVTYNWKDGGAYADGFIAHELAEVCPSAVVGEKDAVDAEGNPKYQSIDTSFLVATLTAAIQEQQAIILAQESALNALTARVAALESN